MEKKFIKGTCQECLNDVMVSEVGYGDNKKWMCQYCEGAGLADKKDYHLAVAVAGMFNLLEKALERKE